MNSGDPGSNSAGENDHPEENMDKKKKKDKVAKEREAYVCSVCSVTCDHPTVFETHLMGKKHAAKVKKHAEVKVDAFWFTLEVKDLNEYETQIYICLNTVTGSL